MYPFNNGNGTVNRLPKPVQANGAAAPTSFGKSIGGTVVQALVLVVAIKLVDAAVEVAMSRFRKPRQPAPNRREEHPVA